jgi:hypothetical protein
VNGQTTTLADAVGGVRGMAETSAPALAFLIAYLITGSDTELSAGVAVGVAALMAVARLARKESPQFALSGLIGVVFAAFLATKTGKAENFYLPALLLNLAYASAYFVSNLVRLPLVGVIFAQLQGEHGWRQDPARYAVFVRASWMWVGLFCLRLVVQLPLYLAGEVVVLGVARTAMGIPLFALALWLTWRLVRPPTPAD